MTPFQLEESAKAPWTRTIVGLGSAAWAAVAQAAQIAAQINLKRSMSDIPLRRSRKKTTRI